MIKKKKGSFPKEKNFKRLVKIANEEIVLEAHELSGDIQEKFYSGQSVHSLGVRTGQARRGWRVIETKKKVSIVNNVPHADQSEEKVIKPKKSKYLAIPVGPALTPAGVPRFSGPRDSSAPEFRVARSSADTLVLLGSKSGSEDNQEIYFVLKKSVKIPARTRLLTPFVKKRSGVISHHVSKILSEEYQRMVSRAS